MEGDMNLIQSEYILFWMCRCNSLVYIKNDHLQNDFRYINGLTSNLFLLVRCVTSHPRSTTMAMLSLLLTSELKWKSRYFYTGFWKKFTVLTGTGIGTFWYSERSLPSRRLFVIIDKHTKFPIRSKLLSDALICGCVFVLFLFVCFIF